MQRPLSASLLTPILALFLGACLAGPDPAKVRALKKDPSSDDSTGVTVTDVGNKREADALRLFLACNWEDKDAKFSCAANFDTATPVALDRIQWQLLTSSGQPFADERYQVSTVIEGDEARVSFVFSEPAHPDWTIQVSVLDTAGGSPWQATIAGNKVSTSRDEGAAKEAIDLRKPEATAKKAEPSAPAMTIRKGSNCISAPATPRAEGYVLELSPCDGSSAQKFALQDKHLIHLASGKCATATSRIELDHAPVALQACEAGVAQAFYRDGNMIKLASYERCFDLAGGRLEAGTLVYAGPCTGIGNQTFDFVESP